jgi:DNA-binding FadR family transcriptional regulator
MARLHRDVMKLLIADIVGGQLAEGDRLPREADLATEFKVSRGVARECIRALEERGLITVVHGRGATVNGPERWDNFDPDVLAGMLESPHSVEILGDYLECRRIIEVEAAGLAAARARKADLTTLRDALGAMEEATNATPTARAEERFHEADIAFHQALISATTNHALGNLAHRIQRALFGARFPLARPQNRSATALPEHRRILAAIESKDPDAARTAMSDHLRTVEKYLKDYEARVRKAA